VALTGSGAAQPLAAGARRAEPGSNAFFVPVPRPDAALRLICLPYAGGAPWSYRDWGGEWLHVEVCTACLPGRGARAREPAAAHIDALVDEFCELIATLYDDKPYALFGHSFGALFSLGLAQAAQQRGAPTPCHVFVSGCPAPLPLQRSSAAIPRTDEALRAMLASNGRLPATLLEDQALCRMAIDALRSDYLLADGFQAQAQPLVAPMTAFYGRADEQTCEATVQAWQNFAQRLEVHALPGGHWFVHEQRTRLLGLIGEALAPWCTQVAG
jgi:medium-chain acyl-[acyl-carrier-protein] hydrolase